MTIIKPFNTCSSNCFLKSLFQFALSSEDLWFSYYQDLTGKAPTDIPKMNLCSFGVRQKAAAAAAKSLQLCPTLWDPIDDSPPGSPIPGILQARTLEWVAISFSNAWKWKVKMKSLSRVWLLETPQTAAYQGPLSMGFARQEYWSGLPLLSPKTKSYLSVFYVIFYPGEF